MTKERLKVINPNKYKINIIVPIVIINVTIIIDLVNQINNFALLSGSFKNWSIGLRCINTPLSRIFQ